jgi:hypothetical protein
MYVCDGDRNGVVHFIGTEYGSKQWVNPVASKALVIKASSPPSRYTDPKVHTAVVRLSSCFAALGLGCDGSVNVRFTRVACTGCLLPALCEEQQGAPQHTTLYMTLSDIIFWQQVSNKP